jgi:dihydroorotase
MTCMSVLLRGGHIVDPSSGTDTVGDVLTVDGRIVAVGGHLNLLADDPDSIVPYAADIVDCRGLLVTPGLMDLHAHVMPGLGDFCVDANEVGVDSGVPIVIDGGTSGVATFDLSRRAVIDHPSTQTKVLAFIDPNQLYLATKDFICHKLEIANDERNLDVASLEASMERNADVIVGLKVRACYTDDPDESPFLTAAQASSGGKPIMVHLGRFPHTPTISTPALLTKLRAGDIITHAFRGAGGMLGPDGVVIPEFVDAVDRGVRLDVGHSGTDFRFREARRLFDQGYLPTTISTDLNVFNIGGPVFSLVETMTKVWALGVELADVIEMVTVNTAASIGRPEFGTLAVGAPAEISVLTIEHGHHELSDGHERLVVDERIRAVGCVRGGTWHVAHDERRLAVA